MKMTRLEQYIKDREELLIKANMLHPYDDALRLMNIYRDIHWLTRRIKEIEEE